MKGDYSGREYHCELLFRYMAAIFLASDSLSSWKALPISASFFSYCEKLYGDVTRSQNVLIKKLSIPCIHKMWTWWYFNHQSAFYWHPHSILYEWMKINMEKQSKLHVTENTQFIINTQLFQLFCCNNANNKLNFDKWIKIKNLNVTMMYLCQTGSTQLHWIDITT